MDHTVWSTPGDSKHRYTCQTPYGVYFWQSTPLRPLGRYKGLLYVRLFWIVYLENRIKVLLNGLSYKWQIKRLCRCFKFIQFSFSHSIHRQSVFYHTLTFSGPFIKIVNYRMLNTDCMLQYVWLPYVPFLKYHLES